MGGDEFVILVEDGDSPAIQALMERVRSSLSQPVELQHGESVSVAITIGAATADGTSDLDDLLGRADAAMYAAKTARPHG